MQNFDFSNKTRIIFGRGEENRVGELIKPLGKKVLLHYGGGSIKSSGLYAAVTASLKAAGVEYIELPGVMPNPRVTLVREGIALARKEGVDMILAVGGGSVIDSAKAIGMGFYFEHDVWDIYEKGIMVDKTLPVATILTIPAAGSEASLSSVISNEEKQMKRGCSNIITRPVLSIINPEYFKTLPKHQIANGVSDIMSHIFERYFTTTKHTDLIDSLCEATLRSVMQNAHLVSRDPGDYDAWCQVAFGGTVAHNDLLGLGRSQDWACHTMEHELSAHNDVAHGAGLAVLTPAWMRYTYKANRDKFLQFAVNVMGETGSFLDSDTIIERAIDRLSDFYRSISLAQKLSELGFAAGDLEIMARRATRIAYGSENPLGGAARLTWEDVLAIYKAAL